ADPLAALKRVFARLSFLIIPLSILFIKYYPDIGRSYTRFEGHLTMTGVSTNKNTLGMVCMILGLGGVWRILEEFRSEKGMRRTRSMAAHGALLAMLTWLLWM